MLRVALVKDWLTSYGGSEEQLAQLHQLFPAAPIFTSVYDKKRLPQFAKADVRTMRVPSFLAKGRNFEKLALFLPHYFKSLDLAEFDLVISVTSGFAKGIKTGSQTKHLCICNTPIRFAWNFGGDNRGILSKLVSPYFRWYDRKSSRDVDYFYANSKNVAKRIKQVYGRDSEVIYPPVKVKRFSQIKRVKEPAGFVSLSRLVPYKRVDLAVLACTDLKLPLTVIGEGPELERLRGLAGPTVKFLGFASEEVIRDQLAHAAALIFCADEDFGIVPVEAMAAGCPVIALRAGGALETVVEGTSGHFFNKQTVASLKKTLTRPINLDARKVRRQAERFSEQIFKEQVLKAVKKSQL